MSITWWKRRTERLEAERSVAAAPPGEAPETTAQRHLERRLDALWAESARRGAPTVLPQTVRVEAGRIVVQPNGAFEELRARLRTEKAEVLSGVEPRLGKVLALRDRRDRTAAAAAQVEREIQALGGQPSELSLLEASWRLLRTALGWLAPAFFVLLGLVAWAAEAGAFAQVVYDLTGIDGSRLALEWRRQPQLVAATSAMAGLIVAAAAWLGGHVSHQLDELDGGEQLGRVAKLKLAGKIALLLGYVAVFATARDLNARHAIELMGLDSGSGLGRVLMALVAMLTAVVGLVVVHLGFSGARQRAERLSKRQAVTALGWKLARLRRREQRLEHAMNRAIAGYRRQADRHAGRLVTTLREAERAIWSLLGAGTAPQDGGVVRLQERMRPAGALLAQRGRR